MNVVKCPFVLTLDRVDDDKGQPDSPYKVISEPLRPF